MRHLLFALMLAGCDSGLYTPAVDAAPTARADAGPPRGDTEPAGPSMWAQHPEADTLPLDWALAGHGDWLSYAPYTLEAHIRLGAARNPRVTVTLNGTRLPTEFHPNTDAIEAVLQITIPGVRLPPGQHTIELALHTDAPVVTWQTSIQTRLEVVAMAADPVHPNLLWAATFGGGLLALAFDEAGAVTRATAYFGHLISDVDAAPPRGRPWQGDGGYDHQTQPAGLEGASVLATADGVYFGALFRGVSYLDHGGTPHDREDDQYALFHPGMHLTPETAEAGFANCVIHLQADDQTGLWLGTLHGLYHVDHGGTPLDTTDDLWRTPDALNEAHISQLALGADGALWVGGGAWSDQAATNPLTVRVPDAAGRPQWAEISLPGDPTHRVRRLLPVGDALWVATSEGLWRLRPGDLLEPGDDAWTRIEQPDAFGAAVNALALDAEGNVWVGARSVCGAQGGLGYVASDCEPCAITPLPLVPMVGALETLPGGRVAASTVDLYGKYANQLLSILVDSGLSCPDMPPPGQLAVFNTP